MPFDLLQRKRTHFVLAPRRREPTARPYHRHVPGRKPTELSAAEHVRFGSFTGLGRSMGSGCRSLRAGEQPRLSLLVRSHQYEPEDAGAGAHPVHGPDRLDGGLAAARTGAGWAF